MIHKNMNGTTPHNSDNKNHLSLIWYNSCGAPIVNKQVAYGINDGFWDPLLLDDDKHKQEHPEWVSDKKGPEFEIPFASPYDFIPSLIIKRF